MCLSLCLFLYSLLHCTLRLSVCHIAVMFRLNLLLPAPVLVFNVACFGEIWLSLYLFLYSMVHYILRLSVTSLACFGKNASVSVSVRVFIVACFGEMSLPVPVPVFTVALYPQAVCLSYRCHDLANCASPCLAAVSTAAETEAARCATYSKR